MKQCSTVRLLRIGAGGGGPSPRLTCQRVQLPFDAPHRLEQVLNLQDALVLSPSCGDCAFTSTDTDISQGCFKMVEARSYLQAVSNIPSSEVKSLARECAIVASSACSIERIESGLQAVINAVGEYVVKHWTAEPHVRRQLPIDILLFKDKRRQRIAAELFNKTFPDGKPIHMTDPMVDAEIMASNPHVQLSPATLRRTRQKLPGGEWPALDFRHADVSSGSLCK